MEFEYTWDSAPYVVELMDDINRAGIRGWELVSVVYVKDDKFKYKAFLKREVKRNP